MEIRCIIYAAFLLLSLASTARTESSFIDLIENITITVVYDNNYYDPRLQTDWGFSCIIEFGATAILFDTGANQSILMGNMAELGIDVSKIQAIVLSHIHADHVNGLFAVLERNPNAKVYMLASFPESFKTQTEAYGCSVIEVQDAMEILPNILTTGELGTIIREQSLIISTVKGAIVVTGCAHPGVVQIVEKARELVDDEIYLVLGGFHLASYSPASIEYIIGRLRGLGVVKVAPCHCTGDVARTMFNDAYRDNYVEAGVGKIINIFSFGDINDDGLVDLLDLRIAANAFGSCLGHEKWNANVDMDNNHKIDIIDICKIAKQFGANA